MKLDQELLDQLRPYFKEIVREVLEEIKDEPEEEVYLNTIDACRVLGVSSTKLYFMKKAGEITPVKGATAEHFYKLSDLKKFPNFRHDFYMEIKQGM